MKSTTSFGLLSAMRASLIASAIVAAVAGRNQVWAQYDPGQSNLAIAGTPTSTGDDGPTYGGGGISASHDGNRNGNFGAGSVFYENAGAPPLFYQIDLGANQYVNRVQILPRTDTYQSVFGNFNISIFADNGGVPGAVTYSQNFNSTYFGPEFTTALPGLTAGGTQGRFVRIERLDNNYWLTFAEMEVIGSSTPLTGSLATDIALGKPVTLDLGDSAGFGATNASGNDGDINGDFNAPNQGTTGNTGAPVYHSNNHGAMNQVYWETDLGADMPLSYANLFARMGVNSTTQFAVEVYDHDHNLVSSTTVNNSDVNGATPGYDHAVDLTGVTGEFVRVTVGPDLTDSYLSFSELQVFAAVPEPSSVVLAGVGLIGFVGLARRRIANR